MTAPETSLLIAVQGWIILISAEGVNVSSLGILGVDSVNRKKWTVLPTILWPLQICVLVQNSPWTSLHVSMCTSCVSGCDLRQTLLSSSVQRYVFLRAGPASFGALCPQAICLGMVRVAWGELVLDTAFAELVEWPGDRCFWAYQREFLSKTYLNVRKTELVDCTERNYVNLSLNVVGLQYIFLSLFNGQKLEGGRSRW